MKVVLESGGGATLARLVAVKVMVVVTIGSAAMASTSGPKVTLAIPVPTTRAGSEPSFR